MLFDVWRRRRRFIENLKILYSCIIFNTLLLLHSHGQTHTEREFLRETMAEMIENIVQTTT